MQQRQLGAQGPHISAIGIGAMSFSDFYGATSEAESHAILTAALDQGVTHIDTADVYGGGTSETVIGTFLQQQGHRKNQLFSIATKAGIATDKDTGKRYFDNSPAYLQQSVDRSLARLGLDHIDLFYVHRRDADTPIEEVTRNFGSHRQVWQNRRLWLFRNCPHLATAGSRDSSCNGGAIGIFAVGS